MRNRGRVIACAFEPGGASGFGLQVRAGAGGRTVVGYDAAGEWPLDRTTSGAVVFAAELPGIHSGPLRAQDDRVVIASYVDRSSVEVFGGDGETVVTDTFFPDIASTGVSLYADGGDVTIRALTTRPPGSIWSACRS